MAATYGERAAAGNHLPRRDRAPRAGELSRVYVAASRNVDHFIANSRHIADTIALLPA
jgi:hypothetical protein